MSRIRNPYKCDQCGIQRAKDTNHWWLVQLVAAARGPQRTERTLEIRIEPWTDKRAAIKGMQHGCGVDCMIKLTAKFAQQITEGPASPVPLPNSNGPVSGPTHFVGPPDSINRRENQ